MSGLGLGLSIGVGGPGIPGGGAPGLTIAQGVRALTRPSLHHFAKWQGKYPDYMMIFCDDLNSWAGSLTKLQNEMTSYNLLSRGYDDVWPVAGISIEWVFPLCTTAQDCAVTAAGTVDTTINSMLTEIANFTGGDEITVRLGWEFNITAYPWNTVSANSKANYIAAFQHVVDLARAIDERFRFTWCPNWAAEDPMLSYPGDDYVDVFGMDCYFKTQFDQSSGQTGEQVWAHKREAAYGLDWLVAEAAAHSKRWALCEYGGNANEVAVMAGFCSFIQQYKAKYHGYWDQSTDAAILSRISNGDKPSYGDVYRSYFGGSDIELTWDPLLYFQTDLVTWYDASKEASFTLDDVAVTRWYPEYGEAKYMIQATAANKPVRSETARNALPGVTFDGSNDVLVQTDVVGVPAGQAAISYGMQFYGAADVGSFAYAAADAASTGGIRSIGCGSTGRPLRFNSTGNLSTTGLTMVDTDRGISISIPAGATPTVSLVSGGGAAQTAAVAIPATAPSKVVFGANGATSDGVGAFWHGTIQERITVKRALSTDDVNKWQGYLAHKWKGNRANPALPIDHPYYAAPPTL